MLELETDAGSMPRDHLNPALKLWAEILKYQDVSWLGLPTALFLGYGVLSHITQLMKIEP